MLYEFPKERMSPILKGLQGRVAPHALPFVASALQRAFDEGFITGHEGFRKAREQAEKERWLAQVELWWDVPCEVDDFNLGIYRQAAELANKRIGEGYVELIETKEGAAEGATRVYIHGCWPEIEGGLLVFGQARFEVIDRLNQQTDVKVQ